MDIGSQTQNIVGFSQSEAIYNRAKAQLNSIAKTSDKLDARTLEKIDQSAKEYEAVFISQMLSHSFEGVGKGSLFHGGQTEDAFQGFLIQEYGKIISDQGGIGLAEHVRSELIKIQEGAQ